MGRKKKIIVEEQPKIEKPKLTDTISYNGTVKVSIQKGKKTLSSQTFHNEGKLNLFKFLCNCLAGNYESTARPCKIVLFKGEEAINAGDAQWFTVANKITPAILSDTTAIVKEQEDKNKNKFYTTTYHFRIPYAYISGDTITKAALFNSTPNLNQDESLLNSLYATYKFTKTVGGVTSFDPIKISSSEVGNFSIIIEWTMALKDSNMISSTN